MFGLKDRYVYVDVDTPLYRKWGNLSGALVKKGWRRGTLRHTEGRYFVVDWDSNDSTIEVLDQYQIAYGD